MTGVILKIYNYNGIYAINIREEVDVLEQVKVFGAGHIYVGKCLY